MMQNRQDFEGAWGSAPGMHPQPPPGSMMAARGGGGAGWANEFHGHGPRAREPMMMHQPHPAELEVAWAARAQQAEMYEMSLGHAAGRAGPVRYGHAGPPPPPRALTPGFAPGTNGQVTSPTASAGVVASSSNSRNTSGTDNDLVAGVEDRRSGAAGADADAEGVVAAAAGGNEVDEGGGEVGASARALAAEMASDPDGRFRDSELLRFAGRLGTGGLQVSGDKVLALPLFR